MRCQQILTDTKIRQIKPRERDYKVTDFNGLQLLVRPSGSKLWRFAYRFGGKQKQLALGAYPEVTLAEARERRDAARRLLANGRDPSLERRLERIATSAGGSSFREVAEELLEKRGREGLADITLQKNRWLLVPAYQTFGDRPVGEITAPELLHALRKFEVQGRYDSARRLRTVAGMVFRYAIATGRASRDISLDLRGALISPKAKHRARFKAKARHFLKAHEDHIVLHKLRQGRPLTPTDLGELEKMLLDAVIGEAGDIAKARETSQGFGRFVRSLVGLDRATVQAAFGDFISAGTATAAQIEFINMVVEHLTDQGVMDPELLYSPPFTDVAPTGPEAVFDAKQTNALFERIEALNMSAVA